MKEEVMIYQVVHEDATHAGFKAKLSYINKALENRIQELVQRANQFGMGFQMQKFHLIKFIESQSTAAKSFIYTRVDSNGVSQEECYSMEDI
jgi:hypothetical protein